LTRERSAKQNARTWILAQPIGTVLTPTSVAQAMAKEDLRTNSGTTSQVLRQLVDEGRAERTQAHGFGAPRGGFRIIPPAPIPLATRAPGLPFDTAAAPAFLTDRDRAIVNAFFKIQEGLDELRAALVPNQQHQEKRPA